LRYLKRILQYRSIGLLLIIILFATFMSITQSGFLTSINIFGMLYSISVNAIIAGAMTSLFVSGGFDMSVGSTLGFCGIMVALLMKWGIPVPMAIIIVLIIGACLGAIMGYIIAHLGINPFIVTLAGWFMIGSLIFIAGKGSSISGVPNSFSSIASYKIAGVPSIIVVSIVFIIIFEILLQKNKLFRQNFYIGSNEKAATLVGIKVKKVKLINYILTSLMAAVAGILLTSRFAAAYNVAGTENAFQIITAVIIGGASLKGGKGSVIGTFLGLIFVALLYDALVLYKVNILWNKIFIGFILIIAVLIDTKIQKRSQLIRR